MKEKREEDVKGDEEGRVRMGLRFKEVRILLKYCCHLILILLIDPKQSHSSLCAHPIRLYEAHQTFDYLTRTQLLRLNTNKQLQNQI